MKLRKRPKRPASLTAASSAVDLKSAFSFTLPIKLPVHGGGLSIWNAKFEKERILYTPGEIFVHPGNLMHQIAGQPFVEPGDQRITLQGHGIKVDGKTILYW